VPVRRAIPDSIKQAEHNSVRHGTVNALNFLIVHSGKMETLSLEANDAEHYVAALKHFRRRRHRLKGIYLVQDGGSSHIAQGHQGLLRQMSRLVASSFDAGSCVLGRSSGAAQSCVRSPLSETRIVGKSRGLYRACHGFMAGV
jgi:hypothetical protein